MEKEFKRIRIAQIGIGHNHAADKMNAMRKLTEYYDVVGIVEPDRKWREARGGWEAYKGLPYLTEEELLNIPDLEAVAIETDGFDLLPSARHYAGKGLHIHMDKPGGESMKEFQSLLDYCNEHNLAFQQAYVYRYNPALRFLLEVYRKGWLGEIFEIHAVMSRYDGDNDAYRKWLAQFKGGAMYIFAGYLIDIVLLLLGRPGKVTPFLKQTRDDGLIDNGLAVLEYKHATATCRVSVEEIDGMKHRRFIVCGTKGSFEFSPIEPVPAKCYYTQPLTARLTLKQDNREYKAGTHEINCGFLNDRYDRQMIEFARIIRGEIGNPFPYQHEALLHEVLLASCGIPNDAGE